MRTHELHRIDDATLLGRLHQLVARERAGMAALLAHLAEVEARKLHVAAGYSSMFDYCLREFRWTEQTTVKRLRAARCARQYPVIFDAVADGRLNVSGVVMLRPHLEPATAPELLARAFGKSRADLELMLAGVAPKPDVPTMIRAAESQVVSPGTVELASIANASTPTPRQVPVRTASAAPARLTPLTPERFSIQVTVDRETHSLLRRAQELLSHQCQSGDVAKVLNRALARLVADLEKRKYATTQRPREPRARKSKTRHVPALVRRAVRERDGDRCTFVSAGGRRCESRTRLELDHVIPFARGGAATVDNIRLRCRTHNQFEAEQAFGAGFMAAKRDQPRRPSAGAG
jgi:5-methylcytosine-specific restriction endonuclease McrA